MGKKNQQSQREQRSKWIPPVGNGGIQKKQHANHPAPFLAPPNYPPHQTNHHYPIPGYPILPFAVRLVPGPSVPAFIPPPHLPHPPSLLPTPNPNPYIFPSRAPLIPPPSSVLPPPSSLPHPHPSPPSAFIPPPLGPIPNAIAKSPARKRSTKKKNAGISVVIQSNSAEGNARKAQLKYARQMAARANKRSSIAPAEPEVKREPGTPTFNLFRNIAQRYRGVQKDPDAIDLLDDTEEEDDDEVEEIVQEQNDAAVNNTIAEDMSICTVDEVGEQTITDEGDRTITEEKEGEIVVSDEDDEEEEEEIVCLGEQKTKHVMSEAVVLDDDESECEIEEVDVINETTMMDKAFSEKRKSLLHLPMEESIIDLSLEDDNSEKVAELPEFIPLIDGAPKNARVRGKYRFMPKMVQSGEGGKGQQVQNGASTSHPWPSNSIVVMTRTKSNKDKKRDTYRKRAETRALEVGASPATVARAVAASTCTFTPAFTPSKIPLPNATAPLTPLAHLYRFPPGSAPLPPPSSSMGLIQTRGISTSAPQSQPVGMSMHPPPFSSSPPTLAAVLQDEAAGVVRDALTANGIYRRQWEEKWMEHGSDGLSPSSSTSSPDIKVDPSAAPFRICSYNVLCQKTISATDYLYRHTRFQPHVLEWSHRWPLIQKELSELNADVFGLQEIQDVHFEEYYEPFMKSLGYMCLFQRKSETIHSDGLGVFVRANRFKISSIQTVDFLVPGDNLLNRGNVAQLLRLECQQTGASLIVTNTHILFNEKRGDIKLAQIALLMANIHAIRQDDEPVICLGDWNLEPSSDLYNYITIGSLDATQFVPRYGSGQLREGRQFNMAPMRELPMDTHLKTRMARDGVLYQSEGALLQSLRGSHPSMFSHQIPLASTYAPYRERHVSTFHKDIANPDFIFYTTEARGESENRRLRLIRRLGVPPELNIRQHLEPWPNHHVPSDHIPLMAEFYLAK